MGKIGDQAGFVGPAGHGNSYSDCFPTKLNFDSKTLVPLMHRVGIMVKGSLTTAAIAHNAIQNSHKLRNDLVHFIEACEDRNYI